MVKGKTEKENHIFLCSIMNQTKDNDHIPNLPNLNFKDLLTVTEFMERNTRTRAFKCVMRILRGFAEEIRFLE